MESKGPFYAESWKLYYHLRRCWLCVLFDEEGVTNEGEARAFILVSSVRHEQRRERHDTFKRAFERAAMEFPRVSERSDIVQRARGFIYDPTL